MLKRAIPTAQWAAITLVAALIFSLLLLRTCRNATTSKSPSPPPVIVEVRGDIPHPGIHLLPGPTSTVSRALEAAGWNATDSSRLLPEGIAPKAIESGNRLRVLWRSGTTIEVAVENMDGATGFALGFKLDLNSASEEDLLLVPLMRPQWARTIVERRKQKPWKLLDELDEIHGVGPKTLEKWRPHLEVLPPSP
jgi:competence protein ComEA